LIPQAYRQVQPSDVQTLLEGGSVDFMNNQTTRRKRRPKNCYRI
jgi:hypothetical protein